MDGISRTSGVGGTITLEGTSYTVDGRILRHYAEIEAEIIKRRGNPFDLIRQAKDALKDSPEIVREFVSRAFDEALKWRIVSVYDIGLFLEGTWSGTCFALWLAIRDNDRSKLTLEEVSRMYCDEYERRIRKGGAEEAEKWKAEIESVLDQANGTDELGNSTGSPSEAEQANQE